MTEKTGRQIRTKEDLEAELAEWRRQQAIPRTIEVFGVEHTVINGYMERRVCGEETTT